MKIASNGRPATAGRRNALASVFDDERRRGPMPPVVIRLRPASISTGTGADSWVVSVNPDDNVLVQRVAVRPGLG